MTSFRLHLLLILFASIFFGGISNAQKNTKRGVASFTAIALSGLPYKQLYYRNGRKFIAIELKNGRRSKPHALSSAKVFEVFIDHDDPKNPYKLVGKTSLVPGTQKMLYFIGMRGAKSKSKLPLALYGIDDSDRAFPDSSYRFISFINTPLNVEFNNKRFIVRQGKPMLRKLSLSKEGKFSPFLVRNSKGEILGGTRLFSHAANREMVLIFPPKKGQKRLDVRYFSD